MNAKDILPDLLVKELQEYIQGVIFIYLRVKTSIGAGEKYLDIKRNYGKETLR